MKCPRGRIERGGATEIFVQRECIYLCYLRYGDSRDIFKAFGGGREGGLHNLVHCVIYVALYFAIAWDLGMGEDR